MSEPYIWLTIYVVGFVITAFIWGFTDENDPFIAAALWPFFLAFLPLFIFAIPYFLGKRLRKRNDNANT